EAGRRSSSKRSSAWPEGAWSYPNTGRERSNVTPGEFIGTRIIDCCLCRSGWCGSVLPMKMMSLHRGGFPPDVHHFRPLMMELSPSRLIELSMFVASEEATAGSTMASQEQNVPVGTACNVPSRGSLTAL